MASTACSSRTTLTRLPFHLKKQQFHNGRAQSTKLLQALSSVSSKRFYATDKESSVGGTSGPAEPITARPTSFEAETPANPGLPHASHVTAAGTSIHPSVGPVPPVESGQSASASSGSSSGSADPLLEPVAPQIIVEKAKRSFVRRWVVRFARTVLVVVLGTTGYIIYRELQLRCLRFS